MVVGNQSGSGGHRLDFFKSKIKETLLGIKDDLGKRYALYIAMVDSCEDYEELREMAELELQIDMIQYTKNEIQQPLDSADTNIKELRMASDYAYKVAVKQPEVQESHEDIGEQLDDEELTDAMANMLMLRMMTEPLEEQQGLYAEDINEPTLDEELDSIEYEEDDSGDDDTIQDDDEEDEEGELFSLEEIEEVSGVEGTEGSEETEGLGETGDEIDNTDIDEFDIDEDDLGLDELGDTDDEENSDEYDEFSEDSDLFSGDDDDTEDNESGGTEDDSGDSDTDEFDIDEDELFVDDDSDDSDEDSSNWDSDTDEFDIDEDELFVDDDDSDDSDEDSSNGDSDTDEFDIDEDELGDLGEAEDEEEDSEEGSEEGTESEDSGDEFDIEEDDLFGDLDSDDEDEPSELSDDDFDLDEEDEDPFFNDLDEYSAGVDELEKKNAESPEGLPAPKKDVKPNNIFDNGTERGKQTQKLFNFILDATDKTDTAIKKVASKAKTQATEVKAKTKLFELGSDDDDDILDF